MPRAFSDVWAWMQVTPYSALLLRSMKNTAHTIMKILLNSGNSCRTNDLTVDGAMTDTKGDRGLPPSRQPDPDMYLRVVERKERRYCCERCQSAPDRDSQFP